VLMITPEVFLPLRRLTADFHAGVTGRAAAARLGRLTAADRPPPPPPGRGAPSGRRPRSGRCHFGRRASRGPGRAAPARPGAARGGPRRGAPGGRGPGTAGAGRDRPAGRPRRARVPGR
jgi:hypothetical protein